jgi:hypothetical protein
MRIAIIPLYRVGSSDDWWSESGRGAAPVAEGVGRQFRLGERMKMDRTSDITKTRGTRDAVANGAALIVYSIPLYVIIAYLAKTRDYLSQSVTYWSMRVLMMVIVCNVGRVSRGLGTSILCTWYEFPQKKKHHHHQTRSQRASRNKQIGWGCSRDR